MNERMVEYIKKYLNEGHTLEQIYQALLTQGYPDSEIKESALAAMQASTKKAPPDKHASKKLLIIISAAIIILLLSSAIFYFLAKERSADDEPPLNNNSILTTNNTATDTTQSKSLGALIDASKECGSSQAIYTSSSDFFGIVIKTKTRYEIVPSQPCELHMTIQDYSASMDLKTQEYLLSKGVTLEEMQSQISNIESEKDNMIGRTGICVFEDLQKMQLYLQKKNDGTFSGDTECNLLQEPCVINEYTGECIESLSCISTGDALLGQCEGKIFINSPE